jgi:hypothetical protein
MWNLRIDTATAELVGELARWGVASIVLKGASLAGWYPQDSDRTYLDGDVLVATGSLRAAARVLARLGYRKAADERGLPAWWIAHAWGWERDRDGVAIDLHTRLQGVELDPAVAWERLWSDSISFRLGGRPVQRLSEPAQVLYATLHATHHGVGSPRGLRNLNAALAAVDESAWRGALELAGELDALAAFSTGLRLTAAGSALAERIGVPAVRSVRTELFASTPPPVALGFEQLAAARGLRRAEIILRKLLPPPGFIRHWWPPAARSRRWLLVGYLYRPVWLLRRAPAGYGAWRDARRRASSSP